MVKQFKISMFYAFLTVSLVIGNIATAIGESTDCLDFTNFDSGKVTCTVGQREYSPLEMCECLEYSGVPTALHIGDRIQVITTREQVPYTRDDAPIYTLPDGENLAARMGNFKSANHTETLTYTFDVPLDAGILVMKYAVIMGDAPDHDVDKRPRFMIEFTDASGNSLDNADCIDADFNPGVNTSGWIKNPNYNFIKNLNWYRYRTYNNAWGAYECVGTQRTYSLNQYHENSYKDWTTIGVPLEDYRGQTIKIKLTTMGCGTGAHFCVAYFTFKCVSDKIETTSCGDEAMVRMVAPEGFNYQWFPTSDPTSIVSINQTCDIAISDPRQYSCRLIYKENPACSIVLTTYAQRYRTVANASVNVCGAVANFTNRSCTVLESGNQAIPDTVGLVDNMCDTCYVWDFGDGSTSTAPSPAHNYVEDGKYVVTLRSYIMGRCYDEWSKQITIKRNYYDTLTVCSDELPITWHGETFPVGEMTQSFKKMYKNIHGCDSVINARLIVNPSYHNTLNLTICQSQLPYILGDTIFKTAETKTYVMRRKTILGCDSVTTVNLKVNPTYAYTVEQTICENDLPLTICDSNFLVGTTTNTYQIHKKTINGCDSIITLRLTVNPQITNIQYLTIRELQLPYTWRDEVFPVGTVSGPYTFHRQTVHGCDSTIIVNLNVLPKVEVYRDTTACSDGLPKQWGGRWFTPEMTSTAWRDTLINPLSQRDSIVHYSIVINRAYNYNLPDVAICENERDAFNWNGHTLPVGTTVKTLEYKTITHFGCDSIIRLKVTVNPTYTQTVSQNICATQLPYAWRDTIFDVGTTSKTFVFNKQTVYACDSITTLNLTVNPTLYTTVDTVVCDSELPFWFGSRYFTVGSVSTNYTDKLSSVITGCDSIVTYCLTVNPTYNITLDSTICSNQLPFIWGGKIFNVGTTSTAFTYNGKTAAGCDSIVTLNLTVNATDAKTEYLTLCANESRTWRDTTFLTGSQSGTFVFHRLNRFGCDSVVTLKLTVNPIYNHVVDTVMCDTQLPFFWGDKTFSVGTTSTSYQYKTNSVNGCDSTVRLNLTVNPTYELTYDTIVCDNELPFLFKGKYFPKGTTTTSYTYTGKTKAGCDSIVTLNVTVYPTYKVSESKTLCESELPYFWHGKELTFAGTFTDTMSCVTRCDSIVTLTLTVNPTYHLTENVEICASELPYFWNGIKIPIGTTEATRVFNGKTVAKCDSIVTLHLTVRPVYDEETTLTICDDELPYIWRGNLFPKGTISGDKIYYETSVYGCDSIVTLHLTVNSTYQQTKSVTICDSELPYTWRDTTFAVGTKTGKFIFNKLTVSGCDSIVTLTLTVNPTYHLTENVEICASELPYVWNGIKIPIGTTEATRVFNGKTVAKCDSIVTLHLTVRPVYDEEAILTICDSELPYIWRGNLLPKGTISGNKIYHETSVYGCDSIVTLHLTVNPTYKQTESVIICDNELPYMWNGRALITAGTYRIDSTSVYGCDSVIILNLAINPAYAKDEYLTRCADEFPFKWNDKRFEKGTTSCTYTYNGKSQTGCDSLVTLHLTVNATYKDTVDMAVCDVDLPIYWGEHWFDVGTTDTEYTYYTKTVNGCDSIVTLRLKVNTTYKTTEKMTRCADDFPYTWNGKEFPIGTTNCSFTYNGKTVAGCDSVVTLDLSVMPIYNDTVRITVCDGDSSIFPFYFGDRNFYAGQQSTEYTYYGKTTADCDSIVTLQLTVLPTYVVTVDSIICSSELPILFCGKKFLEGTESGIYPFYLKTKAGCDSIVTLNLTVHPAYRHTESVIICDTELPYTWCDTTFAVGTKSGKFIFNKQTANGCDSIVTLNLIVNPTYKYTVNKEICDSELPFFFGDTIFGYGQTDVIYTYYGKTKSGCDSTVTLNLTVHPIYDFVADTTICSNELPMLWHKHYFPRGSMSGEFIYKNSSVFGCDSIVTLRLTVNPAYNEAEVFTICDTELPYTWRDTTFAVGTKSGNFIFNKLTVNGCDSIVTFNLTVNRSYNDTVDMTRCADDFPFVWNGKRFPIGTTTTEYTFNGRTHLGCDSIVTLRLTVNPTYDVMDTLILCSDDLPYLWNEHTMIKVGTLSDDYTYTFKTVANCDSVVRLHLVINDIYKRTEQLTRCANEFPFTWNDTTFKKGTKSLRYIYKGVSRFGCDSIVTLDLTVNPSYSTIETMTVCANDFPFKWNDKRFPVGTTTTEYTFNGRTLLGCDSIVTLQLIVNPIYNDTIDKVICADDLPFFWGDRTFPIGTQNQLYTYETESVLGCDSVVTLNLTVNPIYNDTEYLIVCDNETTAWRDTVFLEGSKNGKYIFHRKSVSGCDSIVTLYVTVCPSYRQTEHLTLCSQDLPFHWRDTIFKVGTISGGYILRRQTVNGCDSIVTLRLTVNQSYKETENIIICSSELPYIFRDTLFRVGTQSQTIVFNRYTVNGCDSIVTLNLTVNPSYNQIMSTTICDMELPYTWRDTTFNVGTRSGTFHFSRRTNLGYDSLVTLRLKVNTSYKQYESLILCSQELPYEWRDTILGVGSLHRQTLVFHRKTTHGCDSMVTLDVTVHPSYVQSESLMLCSSELPYIWRDTVFRIGSVTQTIVFHRQTNMGCDSIVTLNLIVNPSYKQTESLTLCSNELPYVWRDTVFEIGSKSKSFVFHRTTSLGCDSTVTLNLTIRRSDLLVVYDTVLLDSVYRNAYGFDLPVQNQLGSTLYEHNLINIEGCDSIVKLYLTVVPPPFELFVDPMPVICADSNRFTITYRWTEISDIPTSMSIKFAADAKRVGFRDIKEEKAEGFRVISLPTNVRPDLYHATIVLKNKYFTRSVDFEFMVRYPSAVIAQKWNDVLALRDHTRNGGYYFWVYQWYKNDVKIYNATKSFIYLGPSQNLDINAEYTAGMKRVGEEYEVCTCPVIPERRTDVAPFPTLLGQGQIFEVTAPEASYVEFYDMYGRRIAQQQLRQGSNVLTAPWICGAYVLRLRNDSDYLRTYRIVVQ